MMPSADSYYENVPKRGVSWMRRCLNQPSSENCKTASPNKQIKQDLAALYEDLPLSQI
jgi:hypothetical protein